MFTAIKRFLERIKNRMFATKDINKFFDIDIAMSNDMVNSIELWNKILENTCKEMGWA